MRLANIWSCIDLARTDLVYLRGSHTRATTGDMMDIPSSRGGVRVVSCAAISGLATTWLRGCGVEAWDEMRIPKQDCAYRACRLSFSGNSLYRGCVGRSKRLGEGVGAFLKFGTDDERGSPNSDQPTLVLRIPSRLTSTMYKSCDITLNTSKLGKFGRVNQFSDSGTDVCFKDIHCSWTRCSLA